MSRMTTAHLAILAIVATLGLPTGMDRGSFVWESGDSYLHASVATLYGETELRLFVGGGNGQFPNGSYISGNLPLDADLSGVTLEAPYQSLRAVYRRYPCVG